jgi:HlyD family secretion protein
MPRLNFSRQILPVIAVIAILVSAWLIIGSQPERALAQPEKTPPTNPAVS